MRRILAYSSIAQAGYIAIAVVVVGRGRDVPDGYSVPSSGWPELSLLILGTPDETGA